MDTRTVRYVLRRAFEAEPQLLFYFAKCYPDTVVSKRRAVLAGCCAPGVSYFSHKCFDGRAQGTLAELLTPPTTDSHWARREYSRREWYISQVAAYVLTTTLLEKRHPVVTALRRYDDSGCRWQDTANFALRLLQDWKNGNGPHTP